MKPWFLFTLLAPVLSASGPCSEMPRELWLWAWESPQDLRFLESEANVGVAYFAATLRLEQDGLVFTPRRQPLRTVASTRRMMVVRIEAQPDAQLSASQRGATVAAILRLVEDASLHRVQVDFDARQSEREFQRALMNDLRRALPAGATLSMTALASWCLGDRWLADAPSLADEIVPMVFSMGSESDVVHAMLEAEPFPVAACRGSVGVRVGERLPPLTRRQRVYAFANGSWTPAALQALRRRMRSVMRP